MSPVIAFALLAISLFSAGVFLWYALLGLQEYRDVHRNNAASARAESNSEHGVVVTSVLAVIAIANVITALGFIHEDRPATDPVTWGAIFVRGALLVGAIYLICRHPIVGGRE